MQIIIFNSKFSFTSAICNILKGELSEEVMKKIMTTNSQQDLLYRVSVAPKDVPLLVICGSIGPGKNEDSDKEFWANIKNAQKDTVIAVYSMVHYEQISSVDVVIPRYDYTEDASYRGEKALKLKEKGGIYEKVPFEVLLDYVLVEFIHECLNSNSIEQLKETAQGFMTTERARLS